jgi:hypothetical protein
MKNEKVRHYNNDLYLLPTANTETILAYSRTQTAQVRKIIAQFSQASSMDSPSQMRGDQDKKHLHTLLLERQILNTPKHVTEKLK